MNIEPQMFMKDHILNLNKIILLISFMLLTGCIGIQNIMNEFGNPIPDPYDPPPPFIGLMIIYFNGDISIPIFDGTYQWIHNKKKNRIDKRKF